MAFSICRNEIIRMYARNARTNYLIYLVLCWLFTEEIEMQTILLNGKYHYKCFSLSSSVWCCMCGGFCHCDRCHCRRHQLLLFFSFFLYFTESHYYYYYCLSGQSHYEPEVNALFIRWVQRSTTHSHLTIGDHQMQLHSINATSSNG